MKYVVAAVAGLLLSVGVAGGAPTTTPPTIQHTLKSCLWDGMHRVFANTLARGQRIQFTMDDGKNTHFIKQVSGAKIPLPWWAMTQGEWVRFWWNKPTVAVLTTCAGKTKITITVK